MQKNQNQKLKTNAITHIIIRDPETLGKLLKTGGVHLNNFGRKSKQKKQNAFSLNRLLDFINS